MISITIMPCNLPPTVRVSGSNESGGIVLDLVVSHSQNIPVIDEVSMAISVVQLTNAIGFEVSVYAECKYVLVNIYLNHDAITNGSQRLALLGSALAYDCEMGYRW